MFGDAGRRYDEAFDWLQGAVSHASGCHRRRHCLLDIYLTVLQLDVIPWPLLCFKLLL